MEITRELNKEFLMHCYSFYIIDKWSMLMINMPTLMYTYCSLVYYIVFIR